MSNKTINWGKWASISIVAGFAFGTLGWTFMEVGAFAPLPAQVSDHERRISALEAQSATNSVRLDDRLRDIDRDLQVIFKRLDGYADMPEDHTRPRVSEDAPSHPSSGDWSGGGGGSATGDVHAREAGALPGTQTNNEVARTQ